MEEVAHTLEPQLSVCLRLRLGQDPYGLRQGKADCDNAFVYMYANHYNKSVGQSEK